MSLPLYWIGIDLGNRYIKSTSDGQNVNFTISLVAQSQEIYTLQDQQTSSGTVGGLTQPYSCLIGDLAQLVAPERSEMVFGNERHFLDTQFQELNPAVGALIFHTIRLHIPEDIRACEVILCLSLSRREYIVDQETRQCRLANALTETLQRVWPVQLLNGEVCNVRLRRLLVKPQCELSVYAKFASMLPSDGQFHFNYGFLYHHPEEVEKSMNQSTDNLAVLQLKTRLAKKIVVYDIGSYSTQIERISPVNGVITVTKATTPNDIGMMMMQEHFMSLLQAKFVNKKKVSDLQTHQVMLIFEKEEWDGVSVADLVDQTVEIFFLRYWREFAQNVNLEETDTVLLSGQSWQKKRLLDLFLERFQPLAEQYNIELVYQPILDLGKLPALGAYVLAKNWWAAKEKQKTKQAIRNYTAET